MPARAPADAEGECAEHAVVGGGRSGPAGPPADAEGECAEHAVVEVWESPQNHRRARLGQASWGPMTCTMPCPTSPIGYSLTPNSAVFLRRVSTWALETGSS